MNDMNRFLFTEDELKAFVPNTDGEEKKNGRGLLGITWDAVKEVPGGIWDTAKGAINYKDVSLADLPEAKAEQEAKARNIRAAKQEGGALGETIAQVGDSLGYSLGTMGGALAGAKAGAVAGGMMAGPAGAWVGGAIGGLGASGTVADRASVNSFMKEVLVFTADKFKQEVGRDMTEEEWNRVKAYINDYADRYGLWEAIPEAAGNVLLGGVLLKPGGNFIARKLLAGNEKSKVVGRFLIDIGSGIGEELVTETVTAKGQSGIEHELGMRDKPSDWEESFKDIAPVTIGQTAVMALGGKGLSRLSRRLRKGDAPAENGDTSDTQLGENNGTHASNSHENPYRHRDLLSEEQQAQSLVPEVVNERGQDTEQPQAGRTRATVFDTAPSGAAAGEVDLLQIGGGQAIEGATEQRPALGTGLVGLSPNGQQDTTVPVASAGNDMEAAVTPEVVAEVQGTTQQDELADELFRQYQAYRTAQEMRGREPLSFDAWVNGWEEDTEVVDTGAVNVEPARSIDGGMNAGLVGMAPQPAGLTEGMASSPEMTHAALTDTAMPEAAAADVRAVSPETALQGEMTYGRPEQGDGRGPADTVSGQEVDRGSEPAGYAGKPAGEAAVPEQAGGQGRGGRYAALKIPNRDDLPVQFEVVERDEVQPSHLPARDFERNPRYGLENERRYHDEPASRDKVVGNAKNLDPAFLLESVDANQGAPVVDREGNVLGGNGRAMSISLSYDRFRDKAEGYRQALIDNAARLGLDENAIRSMSAPVLVRRVQGDLSPQERQALVSALNEDFKASRERRAEGKSRGDRFSRETLVALSRAFREADSLRSFFDTENSRAIVDRMIRDGVISETERNALVGADGLLNPDGKRVVEEALRGRIAPDYETLSRLPAEVVGKLDAVLPDLIRCEYAGEDWNVTGDMRTALKHIADFKASGIAELQTSLEQADMFTGRSRAQDLNMRARTLLEALLREEGVCQESCALCRQQ